MGTVQSFVPRGAQAGNADAQMPPGALSQPPALPAAHQVIEKSHSLAPEVSSLSTAASNTWQFCRPSYQHHCSASGFSEGSAAKPPKQLPSRQYFPRGRNSSSHAGSQKQSCWLTCPLKTCPLGQPAAAQQPQPEWWSWLGAHVCP